MSVRNSANPGTTSTTYSNVSSVAGALVQRVVVRHGHGSAAVVIIPHEVIAARDFIASTKTSTEGGMSVIRACSRIKTSV